MEAGRGGRFAARRGSGWKRPRLPLAVNLGTALGKEPVHRKYADFRFVPDSMCESGFLFFRPNQ
jgi:hypothetical protein